MSRTSWVFAVLIGLAVAPLPGQSQAPAAPGPAQPPPTFKVEVNYVEIDARVTDAQGKFIGDLTKDDFQISEEGKPQTITVFSRVELPVERRIRRSQGDADRTGRSDKPWGIQRARLRARPGRSPDGLQALGPPEVAARQFIQRYIGANDLAAVVYTGSGPERGQEFTGSRARLLASVDKFAGYKLPSETMSKLDDYYRARQLGVPAKDTNQMERGYKARNSLAALKNLAQYLSAVHGRRKAVVWFGEGIDYDTDNPFTPDASILRDTMKDAIAEATRAGVSFYGVDARGLGAGLDEAVDIGGVPLDDPDFQAPSVLIQNEVRRAQDNLRVMSEQSGGFAIVNQNDLNASFERIVQDNSSYYVLGYYPTNDKRDGRFRKIQVHVTRPGVRVQAREGYSAPKGKAPTVTTKPSDVQVPPEIRDAFASPILPGALGSAPLPRPSRGGREIVRSGRRRIRSGAAEIRRTERDVHRQRRASHLAIDASGKMQDGGRTLVPLKLGAPSHQAVTANGFRVMRRSRFLRAAIRSYWREGNERGRRRHPDAKP